MKFSTRRSTSLAAFLLSACGLLPSEYPLAPPPAPSAVDVRPHPTYVAPPQVMLGALRIEMERTPLKAVQQATGAGHIFHHGDAGNSQYWSCYSVRLNGIPVDLWLMSGELGGNDHAIGAIHVQGASSHPATRLQCDSVVGARGNLAVFNLPTIGSPASDVSASLGEPASVKDGWWLYTFETPLHAMQRYSTMALKVRTGRIVEVHATQATSD